MPACVGEGRGAACLRRPKPFLKKGFGFPKLLSKDNIENKPTSKCGRAKKSFIESS
jgi:hypothetical protein